jgi:hypothetical protein
MAQSTQVQREGVAKVAGRILMAWHTGESASLRQELEQAQYLAGQTRGESAIDLASTLEMERLEALSGAVESLWHGRQQSGAVRLLEHLATAGCDSRLCLTGHSRIGPRELSQ